MEQNRRFDIVVDGAPCGRRVIHGARAIVLIARGRHPQQITIGEALGTTDLKLVKDDDERVLECAARNEIPDGDGRRGADHLVIVRMVRDRLRVDAAAGLADDSVDRVRAALGALLTDGSVEIVLADAVRGLEVPS